MSTTLATLFQPFIDTDPTLSASPGGVDSRPAVDPSAPRDDGAARYAVRAILGRGGMGEVRLCRDARIGRDVAVKVSLNAGDGNRARFLREARIQGQLEHPAIVPVHDLEILDDGSAYFAMKRVRGRTLAAVLAEGTTPLRKLVAAFNSVCLAVEFAHQHGVLHRDIKPGNIMLGDFGEVYLLDWGLAKVVAGAGTELDTVVDSTDGAAVAATAVGGMLGTPGYMAPEQIEPSRAPAGPTTDVYALGAVLFEILAGAPYISGGDLVTTTVLTLRGADPHPATRAPTRAIPAALDAVCARALAVSAADRLRSARELHDAVDRWLTGEDARDRRREMAALHVDAAERALVRDPEGARASALQELGSAVALDPENSGARRALLRLLTSTPVEMPAEVERRIATDGDTQARLIARLTALTTLAYFAFVPIALFIGVREPEPFWFGVAGIFASGVVAYFSSRSPSPTLFWQYVSVVLLFGAETVFTRIAGPAVLVPALLVANSVARQGHPDRWHRRFCTLLGCLVVGGAFAFEVFGDPAYTMVDGGVVVHEHMMKLDGTMLGFLLAASITTVVTPSFFLARTRASLLAAEKKLHVQTWQLEQLVREGPAPTGS